MQEVIRKFCTRDCPDACGHLVTVESGRAVKLEGDPKHPITDGFLCSRTKNYLANVVYSSNRLLHPLKKTRGVFKRIPLETAVAEIAGAYGRILSEDGPAAALHLSHGGSLGFGKNLASRFFKFTGGATVMHGGICDASGAAAQLTDFGAVANHPPEDAVNSKLVIIWGKNPAVTNVHFLPILKRTRENGALVVLIDPVETQTAAHVDVHIPIRPGTDFALATALARLLIVEHSQPGKATVAGLDNLPAFKELVLRYDVARVSAETGLSAAEIENLAALIASRKPASFQIGWGLQRSPWGYNAIRAIDALAAISGNIGVPGGGANYANPRAAFFNSNLPGDPRGDFRTIPIWDIAGGISSAASPPIRAAFIDNFNPVVSCPQSDETRDALESLELVVVQDLFMTDTAKTADYIIPATSMMENDDIVASFWHHYLGHSPRAIEPIGEAISDYDFKTMLAKAMGIEGFEGDLTGDFAKALEHHAGPGFDVKELLRDGKSSLVRNPSVAETPFSDLHFKTSSGRMNLITEAPPPTAKPADGKFYLSSLVLPDFEHSRIPEGRLPDLLPVLINPERGIVLGLDDGIRAFIETESGRLHCVLRHDKSAHPDLALVPRNHPLGRGLAINKIVPPEEIPGPAARFDGFEVTITPALV